MYLLLLLITYGLNGTTQKTQHNRLDRFTFVVFIMCVNYLRHHIRNAKKVNVLFITNYFVKGIKTEYETLFFVLFRNCPECKIKKL